jgi:hypothetical protein
VKLGIPRVTSIVGYDRFLTGSGGGALLLWTEFDR